MGSQEDPKQLLALVSVLISNQVEGLQLKEKLVGEYLRCCRHKPLELDK